MARTRTIFSCSLTFGLFVGLGAAACGDDNESVLPNSNNTNSSNTNNNNQGQVSQPLPAFALVDTNPTSARAGQMVSPRDYLQKVTGWYFTHSS